MMDPNFHAESTCWICGVVKQGRFSDSMHYCGRHQRDEIEFHQSLPDRPLTKEQKQLRMIYRRRWAAK